MNQSPTIFAILISYLILAPIFVIWGRGFILAKANWHKNPRLSRLTMIAIAILFIESLISTYLNFWLPYIFVEKNMETIQIAQVFATKNIVETIIIAIAWGILISALFGKQQIDLAKNSSSNNLQINAKQIHEAADNETAPTGTKSIDMPNEQVRFSKTRIDWEKTTTERQFYVEKTITFSDEQEIISDLETLSNYENLSGYVLWNFSLCLAYGSEELSKATAIAIFRIIQKRNNLQSLRWMANTMLNTGEIPSGIKWEKAVKGLKILLENCPKEYRDELCAIIENSTSYDIAYSYNPSNDESNNVVFVQETKKQSRVVYVQLIQEQLQTQRAPDIITYRVYRGTSKKAAYDFLTKNIVNQKLFQLVIETPEGNFCRDINGIYKEKQ